MARPRKTEGGTETISAETMEQTSTKQLFDECSVSIEVQRDKKGKALSFTATSTKVLRSSIPMDQHRIDDLNRRINPKDNRQNHFVYYFPAGERSVQVEIKDDEE
jgi:hypothetical protein